MASKDGLVILVLAAIFCFITVPTVFGLQGVQYHGRLSPRKSNEDCTTQLANDLYGLGVRLGVYLQWFSGWVSNNFLVEEIAGGLDANAIFLFALIISMVSSTKSDAMTLMDGMIMMLLCGGTVWSVLSLWGYRTCIYRKEGHNGIRRFGGFGTHLRLLLTGSVSWYAIWFWLIGVKGLPRGLDQFGQVDSSCTKKEVTAFGLTLTGIASTFAAATTIVSLAYASFVILAAPIAGITRVKKMWHFLRAKQYASTTRLRFATGASQRQLNIMSQIFRVINLFWILFIMTMVEFMLNENNADGVLGANPNSQDGQILQPAQLLPMLIGAFSFARMLYIAYELWRSPGGDIDPSLGRNASQRYTQAKRGSTQGMNIFKLFAQGDAEVEEETPQPPAKPWDDRHDDGYYDLHVRLNFWQRLLITALPWCSLFWFWPWSGDVDRPVSAGEDAIRLRPRNEPVSLQTPHRTRFADWSPDMEDHRSSMDTAYHNLTSPPLTDRYDPQKPTAIV